jgi:hypothetical protein
MTNSGGELTATGGRNMCLDISLQTVTSKLITSDGREVPFTRSILTLRNDCEVEAVIVEPHATLSQEGGTTQDVSSSLSRSVPASMPPKGTISWDVYDVLLPAHSGTASKIHMFGHRAALNWTYDLAAWIE